MGCLALYAVVTKDDFGAYVMNRGLIVLLCLAVILTASRVAYAGVDYKGGGKPPDKGGYAQQNVNGVQSNGGVERGLMWTDGNGNGGTVDSGGSKIGFNIPKDYTIFSPPNKVKANGKEVEVWYQGSDGALYDKAMNRIKPETCEVVGIGEEEVEICTEEFLDELQEKLYDTLQAAVLAKKDEIVGNECRTKTEASHLVLRTKKTGSSNGGKYLVTLKSRYADMSKSAHSAPAGSLPGFMLSRYEVVADIHNHPPNEFGKDWFSVQDAISAWAGKRDKILYGCTSDVILWLHKEDGRVSQIVNDKGDEPATKWFVKNKHSGSLKVGERTYSIRKDYDYSSSVYDPEEWGTDEFVKFCNDKVNEASTECGGITGVEVGVRGWCNCGDNHGKRYIVGDMFCMYDKLKCDLAYTMCARCGCVVRPKDCVGNGLQIVDLSLYRELKRRNGGRLAWSDAFRPLKTRQSEIEAMPNGQIIVGGVCVCKETDPIKVGFTNKITGEFFVCCLCGRVREPDRNGDMPTGTTALSEMGLHEQAEKAGERIGNWLEGRSK